MLVRTLCLKGHPDTDGKQVASVSNAALRIVDQALVKAGQCCCTKSPGFLNIIYTERKRFRT